MLTALTHFLQTRRIRFRPALLPTLAMLFALGLTMYLGRWQQGRAAEKRALQQTLDERLSAPLLHLGAATLDPQRDRYRRASAIGEYDQAGQIFLDNKFHANQPGYHIITPLRLRGTQTWLLVNRGWVQRGSTYPRPPSIPATVGEVTVTGMLAAPSGKFLELSSDVIDGSVWQNLTLERYRQASGRITQPLLLLATGADQRELRPVEERPDARVEKHLEYMLTWYCLAVTVLLIWLVVNLNISRKEIAP